MFLKSLACFVPLRMSSNTLSLILSLSEPFSMPVVCCSRNPKVLSPQLLVTRAYFTASRFGMRRLRSLGVCMYVCVCVQWGSPLRSETHSGNGGREQMWGWREGEDPGCVWKVHREAGGFCLPLVDCRKETTSDTLQLVGRKCQIDSQTC